MAAGLNNALVRAVLLIFLLFPFAASGPEGSSSRILPVGNASADRAVSPSQISTPTPGVVGVYGFSAGTNPLTGQPVTDPGLLNRRPVMVKISNYPPSVRPQSGLSFADMVFEYYIGEGMNRFLAVFYGQNAEQAGSLRSGRLVDAQLVDLYQGLLVYGSADPRVDDVIIQALGERAISHLEAGCPVICGAKDTHQSPWVYANTARITQYAAQSGIPPYFPQLDGMIFEDHPPQSDQFAIQVGIEYSAFDRGEWRYDPQTSRYLRWEESNLDKDEMVPLTDYLTGEQLSYANIIILFTTYTEYAETLHDITIWPNPTGKRALFFRDGLMIAGSWRTVEKDRPMQFFDQWGLPMPLKPGKTWLVLVGDHSTLEESSSGIWNLNFDL
ncbi:MAG: DUF3048 domain-containing protein [Chloroflexi bacterium]|nr:DUF3048 domain-containing protein [Chloroflexota bacterium]